MFLNSAESVGMAGSGSESPVSCHPGESVGRGPRVRGDEKILRRDYPSGTCKKHCTDDDYSCISTAASAWIMRVRLGRSSFFRTLRK